MSIKPIARKSLARLRPKRLADRQEYSPVQLRGILHWVRVFVHAVGGSVGRVAVVACFLLGATQVFAESAISGAIGANTRWTQDGSPYIVSGDVEIQGDAVLTIEPGVSIYMAPGANLKVQHGGIRALGTAEKPILVRSEHSRSGAAAAPGDWGQWVFAAGTTNTQLDYVEFEHGRGLQVLGAAPVLNNLNLRNHLGAAVTVDLAASPRGVGLQASGNTINGIAVPAGEINGAVRWGLRGIPYVVTAGVVSVGSAPSVQTISPNVVEQGQAVTMVVNGNRLSGLQEAVFSRAGVQATIFPGGSSTQVALQVQAQPTAQTGAAQLRLRTDAGDVIVSDAITVTVPQPSISALDPATVLAGAGAREIKVSGRNFMAASQVLFNAAAAPTQFISATELRATLPNQTATGALRVQVRTPDQQQPGQELLSAAVDLQVQAPVPPVLTVEPTPIALPPDNKPHQITIRLSKADYRDNTLTFSVADPAKASVNPASITIPAGQVKAEINVTSMVAGTTNLGISSPTLASVQVPMFITNDFRGVNTAISAPVGVVRAVVAVPVLRDVMVTQPLVGVSVGAVLTDVAPSAWSAASEVQLTVHGRGIPEGAQLSLVPSTGITIGSVAIDADGSRLRATLQTAADAPLGVRKVVIKDATGREVIFADPAKSVVSVMTGGPAIESIQPYAAVRGGAVNLLIRGVNLQQGRVRVVPDSGVEVDTVPVVSSDGKSMTVRLALAVDAPLGSRVIQVITPVGATAESALSSNTFTIASAMQSAAGGVASPVVGVRVGNAVEDKSEPRHPASSLVGVLVGAGVIDVTPRVGVIGADIEVVVRGSGLRDLSEVGFEPAAGLTIANTLSVNADGTEARFTVRVDAAAELGARRLVLKAQGQRVFMVRPELANFLVSAPIPELHSTLPQVIGVGRPAAAVTVRGKNFLNLTGIRIEPSDGLTIGPITVNDDKSALSFTLQAAAGSASGPRTVVVSSAAGDSSTVREAANTIWIAAEVGPSYVDIAAPAVGVVLGSAGGPPNNVESLLLSPAVGVQVGDPPAPVAPRSTATTAPVGVLLGTGAVSLSPGGWLRGASGTIVVEGQGLASVTMASVIPDTGVLLGTPSANADGTQLLLPITIAPDAPLAARHLRLRTSTADVLFTQDGADRLSIGEVPNLTSIAPIVLERGKLVVLTIRGSKLATVTGLSFAAGSGLRSIGAPIWGEDGFGEYLKVNVTVTDDAILGQRVLQLIVPGGATSAEPGAANTVTVVVPQ